MMHSKAGMLILAGLTLLGCRSTSSQVRDASSLPATASHFDLPTPELGSLQGSGGMQLSYQAYVQPGAKDSLVMISGFTESYLFYDELIADFYKAGWSIYIMDNRGMGKSGRAVGLSNPEIVHVDSVEDYVDDEDLLVNNVVRPATSGRMLLFAHSTGGLIGAKLLARHPSWFSRAVLNCPLLTLNLRGPTQAQADVIIGQQMAAHREMEYIPGGADFVLSDYTFATNNTTHDPKRFEVGRQVHIAHPEINQGGPSNGFDNAVFKATAAVETFAPQVTTPVLLIQAGQDEYVMPEGENLFCRLAKQCTLRKEPLARHEAFRETDDIRTPLVAAYISHLSQN